MRVLIVDAFSSNQEGRRKYQTFKNSVKQAFSLQKIHNTGDIEFIEVNHETIDSYLFELNSVYLNRDAEKLFDHLDFVFIDGEANMLPWLPRTKKFLILIRMCKRTNKILFACTFAMQVLVYICATNFNIDKVINGKWRGSQLKEIYNIPKETIQKLSMGDVFLDNATGDIYCYDNKKEEFHPVANTGIHNNKAAQENEKVSKAMLKSYQYFVNAIDKSNEIYVGKLNECKARIFKQYVQHWLVKGLGFQEFLVPAPNSWDVHPVNATMKENVYTVFAESPRGPQVILHHNVVGVQFHVDPKYPPTTTVLNNFVVHMMQRFQTETDKLDFPLSQVSKFGVGMRPGKGTSGSSETKTEKKSLKSNEAKHSGFAFSLRGGEPLTVKLNSTTADVIKLSDPKFKEKKDTYKSAESSELSSLRRSSPRSIAFQRTTETQLGTHTEPTKVTWKSKKEIREMLHPGYPTNLMPKKGNVMNGTNLALAKTDFNFNQKPTVKVVISSRPYTRYSAREVGLSTFQKTRTGKFANLGHTVRASDQYLDPESKFRREQNSQKGKWVDKRDFKRVFSAGSIHKKPLFDVEPSLTSTQNFREENKNKWIAGSFKTPSY